MARAVSPTSRASWRHASSCAPEDLRSDVQSVIDRLESVGALDLEPG